MNALVDVGAVLLFVISFGVLWFGIWRVGEND